VERIRSSKVLDPGAADLGSARTHARFRALLCASTLLMIALSWPLWVGDRELPRVPFVPATMGLPEPVQGLLIALGCIGLAVAATGRAWRAMLWISLGAIALLVVEDQHRFQPWIYQWLLTALGLATASRARGLGFARLFVVACYFHSGLSKLDASFCAELGRVFLETALRPVGLEPEGWPAALRLSAILAMPVWELLVAAGLCFGPTRRWALAGAILMHAGLSAILGPWALGHSPIVLVWNVALACEDVLLFWRVETPETAPTDGDTPLVPLARVAFLVAVVMPFGERMGIWDTWPSFALYASHAERTECLVHQKDVANLPASLARHVRPPGDGDWRRLDLTAWSRAARGVPVYPQGRACNGLAEALAAHLEGEHPFVVIQWSRAGIFTRRRTGVDLRGFAAIRRHGDRYVFNAHPSGGMRFARRPRDGSKSAATLP
jgi:hypothetical protein